MLVTIFFISVVVLALSVALLAYLLPTPLTYKIEHLSQSRPIKRDGSLGPPQRNATIYTQSGVFGKRSRRKCYQRADGLRWYWKDTERMVPVQLSNRLNRELLDMLQWHC